MPAGMQKNVRLSEQGAEMLRALKYDLDASDGEVVSLALESKVRQRVRYHVARLRRAKLGLTPLGDAASSRTAIVPLLAALNGDDELYRLEDDVLHTRLSDGTWRPGSVSAPFSDAAQAVVQRAVDLVRDLSLPRATPAVLLLACCTVSGAERFAGLGVPVHDLALRLRDGLHRHTVAEPPADVPFTPAAKSVLMEGCAGMAALDGIERVEIEHILIASLQADDEDVMRVRADLQIDADSLRGLLWV